MSLKVIGVTDGLMVMATGEDGVAEGVLWRDIDMPFVSEDMVIKLPVQESGVKGGGDIFQGQL